MLFALTAYNSVTYSRMVHSGGLTAGSAGNRFRYRCSRNRVELPNPFPVCSVPALFSASVRLRRAIMRW